MCVVSMVGDFYGDKGDKYFPPQRQIPINPYVNPIPVVPSGEIEKLRKEVEDMKELLKRAKIYDQKNNEPDCEIESKIKKLREIAKLVGIDLDDILNKTK